MVRQLLLQVLRQLLLQVVRQALLQLHLKVQLRLKGRLELLRLLRMRGCLLWLWALPALPPTHPAMAMKFQ